MEKVEVGVTYKIKDVSECSRAVKTGATHVKIEVEKDLFGRMIYDLLKNGRKVDFCCCLQPEHLEPNKKAFVFGSCKVGDVVENGKGKAPIIKTQKNGFWKAWVTNKETASFYKWQEAIDTGYKFVEEKERTVDDVLADMSDEDKEIIRAKML